MKIATYNINGRLHIFNTMHIPVELYQNDGSAGAALGAGIGAGIFKSVNEAFTGMKCYKTIEPTTSDYEPIYHNWRAHLHKQR